MKTMNKPVPSAILAFATVLSMGQFVVAGLSKEELNSISTPNSVKTSNGTLDFVNRAPATESVRIVDDNLDWIRDVQVFFNLL